MTFNLISYCLVWKTLICRSMASRTASTVAAAAAAPSIFFVIPQAAHRQEYYQKDSHTHDQCRKIHKLIS